MITLDTAPSPNTVSWRCGDAPRFGACTWSRGDSGLALPLYTVWAARTGRTLRPVPVAELTSEELIAFWADDQLDQDVPADPRRRGA